MRVLRFLPAYLAAAVVTLTTKASDCPIFPSPLSEFAANFKQPEPPLVKPEFETSFIQHKWNQNVSNIATGYLVNSPSQESVRADLAYNGNLASSLFNYANVSKEGLVDNTVTTYSGNPTEPPTVWRDYVNSNFPIFEETILVKHGAVFGGLAKRRFAEGHVAGWNIMYQGAIPVTIYVDSCNVVVGYDYFSPGLRTRVITEFFNTQAKSFK